MYGRAKSLQTGRWTVGQTEKMTYSIGAQTFALHKTFRLFLNKSQWSKQRKLIFMTGYDTSIAKPQLKLKHSSNHPYSHLIKRLSQPPTNLPTKS